MKCAVCNEESGSSKYCRSHAKAYRNVVTGYDQWKEALEIPWKEYLSRIADNPLAGEWAKEVAQYLTKSGER